ncbi:hypothetical protein E2P81_ATG02168 [Venturia nashicola]|nr:hypothetical protein E2P81_ATG02168 [Venturia nashicola]
MVTRKCREEGLLNFWTKNHVSNFPKRNLTNFGNQEFSKLGNDNLGGKEIAYIQVSKTRKISDQHYPFQIDPVVQPLGLATLASQAGRIWWSWLRAQSTMSMRTYHTCTISAVVDSSERWIIECSFPRLRSLVVPGLTTEKSGCTEADLTMEKSDCTEADLTMEKSGCTDADDGVHSNGQICLLSGLS